MTQSASKVDAGFYDLVYQFTGSPREDDQRRLRRQPFPVKQWIAPRSRPGFPRRSEFVEVLCHDLTSEGFSFFLDDFPDFESLVAALGRPPKLVYVSAAVVHASEVLVYPSGRVKPMRGRARHVSYEAPDGAIGTPMVLVGCRFIDKIDRTGSGEPYGG